MFAFFRKTTPTSLLFIFMVHPLLASDLFKPEVPATDPIREMSRRAAIINSSKMQLQAQALSISNPSRYKASVGRGSGVVAGTPPLILLEKAIEAFAECIELGNEYLPAGQVEQICNEIASNMKVANGRVSSISEMFSTSAKPGAGACVATDVSRSSGGAAAASGTDRDHRYFQKNLTQILEHACRSVIEAELNYIKLNLYRLAAGHTDKINYFINFGMAPLPNGHRTSPQLLHDQESITKTCDLVFDCYADLAQALNVAPGDPAVALDARLKGRIQLLEDAIFQAFKV